MRNGHGNVVVIQYRHSVSSFSIAAGGSCHEITHRLRRGHGKVVMISIAAGSSCHEITHVLRRGHGKVVMISIAAGSSFHEIAHWLRRRHGNAIVISVVASPSHEITYRLSIGYRELSSAPCGARLDENAHTS